MIVDLAKVVEVSTDLDALKSLVTAVIGQRCFKADVDYAGELMLHIGDALPYGNKCLQDEKKGSWILGTRASSWRFLLTCPPMIIGSGLPIEDPNSGHVLPKPVSGEQAEQMAGQLAGQVLQGFQVSEWKMQTPVGIGIAAIVNFSGGANLLVLPSAEADLSDDPLPDWELFTPFHRYLRVGAGKTWSYLPSDVLPSGTKAAGVSA